MEKVLAAARGRDVTFSPSALTQAIRQELTFLREAFRAGAVPERSQLAVEAICDSALNRLAVQAAPCLRAVVNATGVLLHTNLGRAVLAEEAATAAYEAARSAVNLEFDLEKGRRGDRDRLVEGHLRELCGAEAATVVNNNAAAVLLALNSLAVGREVIVSRGELVEIGGSFRIPEILAKSGARLREVGSTNRTHLRDYEEAIGANTAAILKVHTSNYRVVGFTAAVELKELAGLGAAAGVAVIEDLGAGALMGTEALGIGREPQPRDRLASGADLVTFSGDKLLGGPQSGLLVGKQALIDVIKKNPLRRALRCDKMTLAALEATLRLYRFEDHVEAKFPALAAIARPMEELETFAGVARGQLAEALGQSFQVTVVDAAAEVGSGSQPGVELASKALVVSSADCSVESLAAQFRSASPPILGRISDGCFLLDLRLIDDPKRLIPSWAEGAH